MKRSPLKRTTPLRRVSKKRAKINRERTKVLARLKQEHPMCQMCGVQRSVDGHELLRRSAGGSITDPANIRAVCRPCHTYITEHPRWALENGWQISRFADRA